MYSQKISDIYDWEYRVFINFYKNWNKLNLWFPKSNCNNREVYLEEDNSIRYISFNNAKSMLWAWFNSIQNILWAWWWNNLLTWTTSSWLRDNIISELNEDYYEKETVNWTPYFVAEEWTIFINDNEITVSSNGGKNSYSFQKYYSMI